MFVNENFLPNDPSLGWDGTFNGRKVEQGVYVYYVSYKIENRIEKDAGDITIMR